MILKKHLVLLVHVLCFLCAHCDDDAFASRNTTTIVESMEPNYDAGSTESLTCCDSTTMASLTSHDPGFTDNVDKSTIDEHLTTIMRESTIKDKRSTTDFQTDSGISETSANYDARSTESFACCDSTTMGSLTSQDPGSTDNVDNSIIDNERLTTITRESTIEDKRSTTDFQTDPGFNETSPNYDARSTEGLTCCDSTTMTSLTSQNPVSKDSLDNFTIDDEYLTAITDEPIIEDGRSTTDSQTDSGISKTSPFSTDGEYVTKTTVPDDATSSTTLDSICDLWPINATEDTKKVVNLKSQETGTEWITLSWDPPCPPNDWVTYLIERCDDEKNCRKTYENNTCHNATDLDPCTQYTFVVKIITECWNDSEGNGLNVTTDDAISEIGDVRSLSANAIDFDAVRLTWLAPEKHVKCITNYSIAQCNAQGQSCNEFAVSVANYTASNLEPCTRYNFTVKTVTPNVESAGVNTSAKTFSPIPSEPQSLQITPSNFSLYIQWEPPQSGSTCLKHYNVSVTPENFSLVAAGTNATISNLYACTSYSVSIQAVNEDDKYGPAIFENGNTIKAKTDPPQLQFNKFVNMSSISLDVVITKKYNHCPLDVLVTMCNYTSTNGTGIELGNGIDYKHFNNKTADESVISASTTVGELSPFTEYTCKAYTLIGDKQSDCSSGISTLTHEDVPSQPSSFSVGNISASQFSLTWTRPEYLPGIVQDYEISLKWKSLFPIPTWCSPETSNSENIINLNDTRSYYYPRAKAYRQYEVKLRAKTTAGWGKFTDIQTIESAAAISNPVTMFTCEIRENPNNTNTLDTILTWAIPCSLNGELENFNVSFYGTRVDEEDHTHFVLEECKNYINNNYTCSVNLKELKGEYNYSFSVYPNIRHVDTHGPMTSKDGVIYPAGMPPQPAKEYMRLITINPAKAIRSTTTATVLLPLFNLTNGRIKYYAIMVSKSGYNNATSTRFNLTDKLWPSVSSWKDAMMSDFSTPYQATLREWNPYPNNIVNYGRMRVVKFVIGDDVTCKDMSDNNNNENEPVYCNGPLKPDTEYHVRMRAFTEGGYTDTNQVFVIRTNAELDVAVVIGVVFGILFLGILTTMMLLVRKCSPYVVLRRFLHSDMPGSPVPAPFTRKKFIAHCQQLVDNPGKLSNEFRLLQTLSVDLQMPTNTACLQANRKKNRYSDILPYDFSRVKLNMIDNDPNTDYINASFIRGYTGEDEYIACQGPKEETTYDFWRMVDQYNINIIVMLTQLVEKGKEKCHQYYPTIRETFRYENMTIRCTSELDFRTYTQRTLVLQKDNKKRSIIQLHFKDWPDHDVPEDFDPMINFCQIMRRNINTNKGFVVVHCSAGIGRTGTLISIDILLQHLRDNRKLDVFGTVYRLRHHRINMVQRESQYAYIYNCIKQVLKNPYFLKTYKPPPVDPVYENISNKTKDTANTDANLVNSLEILKRCKNSVSMESLETIHNLFSWSNAERQRSAINNGLRQYKSMDAIDVKIHRNIIGKTRTLGSVIGRSLKLKDSIHKLSNQNLTQESFPLITCSKSTNVLGDCSQCATDSL